MYGSSRQGVSRTSRQIPGRPSASFPLAGAATSARRPGNLPGRRALVAAPARGNDAEGRPGICLLVLLTPCREEPYMVRSLIRWSVNNPLLVVLLALSLATFGGFAFARVNVEAYPD